MTKKDNKTDKNYVLLRGSIGRDPEFYTRQNGTEIAAFSIGTGKTYTDPETGESRRFAEWHRIVAEAPEHVEIVRGLRKGARVEIAGRLRTRRFTQDGQTRYMTEVVIEKGLNVVAEAPANGAGEEEPVEEAAAA